MRAELLIIRVGTIQFGYVLMASQLSVFWFILHLQWKSKIEKSDYRRTSMSLNRIFSIELSFELEMLKLLFIVSSHIVRCKAMWFTLENKTNEVQRLECRLLNDTFFESRNWKFIIFIRKPSKFHFWKMGSLDSGRKH